MSVNNLTIFVRYITFRNIKKDVANVVCFFSSKNIFQDLGSLLI